MYSTIRFGTASKAAPQGRHLHRAGVLFMDSFGAQNLATKGTQIPYCNAMQDDDWNYNQPVDGDEKVFMCLVDYDFCGWPTCTCGWWNPQ